MRFAEDIDLLAQPSGGMTKNGLVLWVDGTDFVPDTSSKKTVDGMTVYINGYVPDRVTQQQCVTEGNVNAANGITCGWFSKTRKSGCLSAGINYHMSGYIYFFAPQTLTRIYTIEMTAGLNNGWICTWAKTFGDNMVLTKKTVNGENHSFLTFGDASYDNGLYHSSEGYAGNTPDPVRHYTAVVRNNHAEMYVNGELVSAGTATQGWLTVSKLLNFPTKTPTSYISVGNLQTALHLASMRLYNRPLTPKEIRQNFQYEVETGRVAV